VIKLKRWIARNVLLRHMYWLEERDHSMWWYRKVFYAAHWLYPCSIQEAEESWPSGGVGLNAFETQLFWDAVEGY